MRRVWTWLAVAAIVVPSVAHAQVEEIFCEGAENCITDTLAIAFGAKDGPGTIEAAAGDNVVAFVVSQTDTDKVQGWSYGFSIDPAVVSISDNPCATQGDEFLCDTDANAARIPPSFNVSTAVDSDGESPVGFISAVVLSFVAPAQLVQGQLNSLAQVPVSVNADPGAGTLLKFEDGALRNAPSPAVAINITVEGTAKLPEKLIHGEITGAGGCEPTGPEAGNCDDGIDNDCDELIDAADPDCAPPAEEICDNGVDDDEDGDVDCDDSDCDGDPACPVDPPGAWSFSFGKDGDVQVINMTNSSNALAFQLGVSTAGGNLTFSSDLGTDNTRLVELLITGSEGESHDESNDLTVGDAVALEGEVTSLTRGSAIAGFAKGDFFAFDLEPGVGGPGFTVGYVADLDGNDDQIPATGKGAVNEILRLEGDAPEANFSRGDADGNGKINVSDAVNIIQIVLGNFDAVYDCRDALDANDDGSANITDAIPVLRWIFQRGDRLPEPFLACGTDDTADDLGCNEASASCSN